MNSTNLKRLAAAAVLATTVAIPATAGAAPKTNAGKASDSTLTLVSDGTPNWGDTVTFDVSTTATDRPYVQLTCSQNGAVVYSASAGFYADYPWPSDRDMTLSSSSWTGGAADCVADLFYFANGGRTRTLATLTFTAEA